MVRVENASTWCSTSSNNSHMLTIPSNSWVSVPTDSCHTHFAQCTQDTSAWPRMLSWLSSFCPVPSLHSSAKGHPWVVPFSLISEGSKVWPKLQFLSISPHPPFAVSFEVVIPFPLEHKSLENSKQPLTYFAALAQSEFMIAQWVLVPEISHQHP